MGQRRDPVAALAEDVDRDAADAPGGARHGNRAEFGLLSIVFHAVHGTGGRETRRADRHGFAQVQPLRQRIEEISRQARKLAEAAVAGLAQAATGDDDGIAGLET